MVSSYWRELVSNVFLLNFDVMKEPRLKTITIDYRVELEFDGQAVYLDFPDMDSFESCKVLSSKGPCGELIGYKCMDISMFHFLRRAVSSHVRIRSL